MPDQPLKDIARRWYLDILSGPVDGTFEPLYPAEQTIGHIFAAHYINHVEPAPLDGWKPGIEGARQIVHIYRSSFPDLRVEIDDQWVIDNNKVVTQYTVTGTHSARAFLGVPATGRRYRITGIGIDQIEDGKFVQSWGRWDQKSLMSQMGLPPDTVPYPG